MGSGTSLCSGFRLRAPRFAHARKAAQARFPHSPTCVFFSPAHEERTLVRSINFDQKLEDISSKKLGPDDGVWAYDEW